MSLKPVGFNQTPHDLNYVASFCAEFYLLEVLWLTNEGDGLKTSFTECIKFNKFSINSNFEIFSLKFTQRLKIEGFSLINDRSKVKIWVGIVESRLCLRANYRVTWNCIISLIIWMKLKVSHLSQQEMESERKIFFFWTSRFDQKPRFYLLNQTRSLSQWNCYRICP